MMLNERPWLNVISFHSILENRIVNIAIDEMPCLSEDADDAAKMKYCIAVMTTEHYVHPDEAKKIVYETFALKKINDAETLEDLKGAIIGALSRFVDFSVERD